MILGSKHTLLVSSDHIVVKHNPVRMFRKLAIDMLFGKLALGLLALGDLGHGVGGKLAAASLVLLQELGDSGIEET
jgi:hypothetical protein